LLKWQENNLTLSLTDDGRGFHTDVPVETDHFGLAIMQERASEINAHLSISSAPGNGTELLLNVPFSQPAMPIAN
jgi:signal transduction histidine kinase